MRKIRQYVAENGFGPNGIQQALDAASKGGSTKLVAESLGDSGGKIVTLRECSLSVLLDFDLQTNAVYISVVDGDPDAKYPKDVEVKWIGIWDVLSEKNTEDFASIREWYVLWPLS